MNIKKFAYEIKKKKHANLKNLKKNLKKKL